MASHADAHYGWEQFRQLIDPTTALKAQQRSVTFNQKYGAAIRALREEHDFKQSDIKGVTERHLRRVEHGEQPASKAILQALADVTGLSLEDYLKELASRLRR
ncbi:MAG: helix-turn-helix transcriptional regulator [Pirellulaceae bacterium]